MTRWKFSLDCLWAVMSVERHSLTMMKDITICNGMQKIMINHDQRWANFLVQFVRILLQTMRNIINIIWRAVKIKLRWRRCSLVCCVLKFSKTPPAGISIIYSMLERTLGPQAIQKLRRLLPAVLWDL